ncbi:MAG: hypothetical protein ACPG77_19105, partial [Nannocystaceae bacterium]
MSVHWTKIGLLGVVASFSCAPDIPNYEGFWDDEARKRCGNGEIDFHSEECDAGEENDSRAFCTPDCKKSRCGDGLVQLDEECDLGEENAEDGACGRDCRIAQCGDGIVQPGEACDLGEDNTDLAYGSGCSNACQPLPTCGDGTLDSGFEQCDDANNDEQDACTNECKNAVCGDGIVYTGQEACDDGNSEDADACLTTCELPSCGDEIVHPGEECDGQDNCNELCIRDRFVFATKNTYTGDLKGAAQLTGLQVADSICNSRANAWELNTDSFFIAWLSDSETSPAQRFFRSQGRYVLPDGTVVANSWDDLTDGTLVNPINMSEEGGAPGHVGVWSNTQADGTRASDDTCEDWSTGSNEVSSRVGDTT